MNKNLKSVEQPFKTPNLSELDHDVMSMALNSFINTVEDSRMTYLVKCFKKSGFKFETRYELEHFLKTRCHLERYENKLIILRADGMIIAQWWDTVEVKHEDNKVTAIFGKPPRNQ